MLRSTVRHGTWTHPTGSNPVAVRGRPADAVVGDMVEGLVQANRLRGDDAEAVRGRAYARLRRAGLPVPAKKL